MGQNLAFADFMVDMVDMSTREARFRPILGTHSKIGIESISLLPGTYSTANYPFPCIEDLRLADMSNMSTNVHHLQLADGA